MSETLVGKYFIGTPPHFGNGSVKAAIGDTHYLVHMEGDSHAISEHWFVVALSDMVRAGGKDADNEPLPWLFFDTIEQRAKYEAWIKSPPDGRTPRIVRMRDDKNPKPL